MRKAPKNAQVKAGKYVQGLAESAAGELEVDDVGDFDFEDAGASVEAPAGDAVAAGEAPAGDAAPADDTPADDTPAADEPADKPAAPDAGVEDAPAPDACFGGMGATDADAEFARPVAAVTRSDVPAGKNARALPVSRRTLAIAGIAVAALAAIYLGGALYFSSHVFPSTKINGEDASLASISELAHSRATQVTDYKASVRGDGVTADFSGADIDLGFDGDAFGDAVERSIGEWAWPAAIFTSRDLQIEEPLSFNADKLSQIAGAPIDAFNETAEHPQAATISYDSSKQAFSIVKEETGTYIDKEAALRAVSEGVCALKGEIELGEDVREQPALLSDDARLPDAVAKANSFAKCKIELNACNTQVRTVDASLIGGWVVLDDAASAVVDVDTVRKWTQGELSRQCDTIGAQRTYTRADGKQCTVSGGTYGWSIDGAALAEELAQAIEAGSSTAIDIPMSASAARWQPGGADWTSYIDIDLGEQHARFYDESGNIIWESDIVSGAEKDNRSSPTGVYTINSNMGRDRTLIGADENGDGKPDYETPVSYWMPFVGDSVAFHDASWRSSFGGTIYKESGSHGCINLPTDKAAALYDLVKVGTVVVSHG